MTRRASDARVCSPPDNADGGLAHSVAGEPETRQGALDALVERVAAEDLVLVEELRVLVARDGAGALHRRESLGHPVEVRGTGPDRLAQVGRGHERLVEMCLLGEETEGQAALSMDLAAVRLVAACRQPEQRRLARPVRTDQPDPVAERDRRVDGVEDDERSDLAGHAGQSEDAHEPDPATDARAAARRVAAARLVRSDRACAEARAASSAVRPSVPSPASSVQRRPCRRGPPVIVRRIVDAPLRSAAPSRWHHEQKWVERAPMTMRLTGRPQRGHGSPVRW